MKRRHHPLANPVHLGALAVTLALSAPALADQQEADTAEQTQPRADAQQSGSQQASQQAGAQQTGQTVGRGAQAEQPGEEDLADTWSANRLLSEADVIGPDGEEIGSAENLLVNRQGEIVALIAQVGGFWDIGDTHVAVPWDEVERQGYQLRVPVTEQNADEYSLFEHEYYTRADVGDLETVDDDLDTGANIWKATDLLNDYAVLQEGEGYGYVDDLAFDQQGKLQAVIIDATEYVTPGYYAYPWYGYGYPGYAWSPGLSYYALPYGPTGITEFAAFEYNDLYY